MRVSRYTYFQDEMKGYCASYAEKEENKLNRYSDEQVHLWTCRTVETLDGVDLNG